MAKLKLNYSSFVHHITLGEDKFTKYHGILMTVLKLDRQLKKLDQKSSKLMKTSKAKRQYQ